MQKSSIKISNQIDELNRVTAFVEDLAEQWKLPPSLTMHLNLALEEILSNIIFYAYNDSLEHIIDIDFNLTGNKLSIQIIDEGKAFNPLETKRPDTQAPLDEREPGGLGIFLVKQLMDNLYYKRDNTQNILTLEKNI
ncbi:ATP-binding protein [Maribellus comscasis]|uniref:ATP-binding protein n=1 Tax=Maribellus comscasis TaxID=2681766 RepID=A0A6I6JQ79_9BACT|nr:ATP-binding protein [Maribellus comscasis]QGY43170.1 ATP-binding protein [Maribellus comscasis]